MHKLTTVLAAAALIVATGFASAQTAQQRPSDPGMTNAPQSGTSGTHPSDPKSIKKSGTTSGMSNGGAMKKDTGKMGTSSGGQGGGEGGSGK
jgi:hypothetical protein